MGAVGQWWTAVVRRLGWQMVRVGDGSHWPSAGLGGERFRLGGGWHIEEVVRLISLHFHFPLTISDMLQLLLALVASMWWRVGILILITYTRFHSLHCGAHC
jgi:hypothetical protein